MRSNLIAARNAGEAIESEIAGHLGLTSATADTARLAEQVAEGRWSEVVRYLRQLRRSDPSIASAAVLDRTGVLRARDPVDDATIGVDFSYRDYFIGVVATKQPYVSEVFVQKGRPRAAVLALAAPIMDARGRFIGAVQATLQVSFVADFVGQIATPSEGVVEVFDQAGHEVAGNEATDVPHMHIDHPAVAQGLSGQAGGVEFHDEVADRDVLFAYAPMPRLGWVVAIEQPTSVAYKLASGLVGRLVVSGAATVLALLLAWFAVSRLLHQLMGAKVHAESIVSEANDGLVGMTQTGEITDWNLAAEEMFGWSHDEAVGRRLSDLVIPEGYRAAHERGLRRFAETREGPVLNKTIEIWGLHRSGREVPVELTIWCVGEGDDYSFYAFVRDISERRASEEALQESRARKDALFASLAEGVIMTDEDSRIFSINPAMERLAGKTEVEVRGLTYDAAYPAFDAKGNLLSREERTLNKIFETLEITSSQGFNLFFETKDGHRVPVSVTAAPMIDEQGELLGAVEIVRDVSREQEVDQLKSSLVSTVSHELRTPLTMIHGFSELLLERPMEAAESRVALGHIHGSAERLARLIEDLLSVSRIDSGRLSLNLKPVEVADTLADAVAPFVEQTDRDIQLRVEPGTGKVLADRDKLIQIVTNLVSNAIKYSTDGEPVHVSAGPLEEKVEITVEDHGVGLTADELAQVFEKFFRANRTDVQAVGGTGLGLYITRALIEGHGGDIRVESKSGQGSRFIFTLPLATAMEQEESIREKEEVS